jgi:hypothetical protein
MSVLNREPPTPAADPATTITCERISASTLDEPKMESESPERSRADAETSKTLPVASPAMDAVPSPFPLCAIGPSLNPPSPQSRMRVRAMKSPAWTSTGAASVTLVMFPATVNGPRSANRLIVLLPLRRKNLTFAPSAHGVAGAARNATMRIVPFDVAGALRRRCGPDRKEECRS